MTFLPNTVLKAADLNAALAEKADATRSITAGTGLSGGGSLASNVTVSLNPTTAVGAMAASQAQAEAGTVSTALMTPLRTKQGVMSGFNGSIKPIVPSGYVASAGTQMGVDWLIEDASPAYPLKDEAGIWSGTTYAYLGVSTTFNATRNPTVDASPTVGLFSFVNNNGAAGDVVSILGDAVARQANNVAFGANFIARNVAGINGTKLVGCEIDVEPATGTTISGSSGGLLLNIFSISASAPAIQVGGVGGGIWGNGIVLDKISGAGLTPQTGSTGMNSLIDTRNGTYDDSAIVLGEGAATTGIKWGVTGQLLYVDSAGNTRWTLPSGKVLAIRNSTDVSNLFVFDEYGALTLSAIKDTSANQLLISRRTGWTAPTGTASRAGFATSTATTTQLAEALKALIDDLTTHGLIGA